MPTSRTKKTEQLSALEAKLKKAKGVAFISFKALTVEEAQNMRRDLRSKGMTYTVIKKSLIRLAAKAAGLPEVKEENIAGSVAVIVSATDEIAPAASIKKYIKEIRIPKTKDSKVAFAGAIFDGKFLSAAETALLANTPSRDESLAKIMGMLRSGPQKLHGVLNSGFQGLYNVLQNAEKFAS